MTDGSLGVDCANLDDLIKYAREMKTGQKLTCKRYLKGKDFYMTYWLLPKNNWLENKKNTINRRKEPRFKPVIKIQTQSNCFTILIPNAII